MSDKEAVEAVAKIIADVNGINWGEPGFESDDDDEALREYYRIYARSALAAARPFLLEKAARIAERAHLGPVGGRDGITVIAGTNMDAATAIRAAKEG